MNGKTPMYSLKFALTVFVLLVGVMLLLAFTVFNKPIEKPVPVFVNSPIPTALSDKPYIVTPVITLSPEEILQQHLENKSITPTPVITPSPTPLPTITPIPTQRLTPLKQDDYNRVKDTDIPWISCKDLALDINSPNTYLGSTYYYTGDLAVFRFDLFNKASYTINKLKYYVTVKDGTLGLVLYPRTLIRESSVNFVSESRYSDYASFTIPNYKGFYEVTVDCTCNDNPGFSMTSKFNIL